MALPNTGIETELVGDELGVSTRDVGTLCTHQNINKWSKYKPVRHSDSTGLSDAKFKEANWGFNVQTSAYTPTASILRNILSRSWEYQKPRGLAYDEGYRLGDFRSYDHAEKSPIYIADNYLNKVWNQYDSNVHPITATPTFKVGGVAYNGVLDSRLNVEDFKISNSGVWQFKDLYFAIGAFDGDTFHCVTAPYTLAQRASGGAGMAAGIAASRFTGTTLNTFLNSRTETNSPPETPLRIYTFLNTRNDSYSVGNEQNYSVGNIIPLPDFQPIDLSVISEFWLKVEFSSFNIDYTGSVGWNAYINGRVQLPGMGYTNLATIKQRVIDTNNTNVAAFTAQVKIYDNPEAQTSFSALNLSKISFTTPLIPAGTTASSMKVIMYINEGVTTTINETVTGVYYFDMVKGNNGYYIVEFTFGNHPITTFRNNAVSDDTLPNTARFEVNPRMFYSGIGASSQFIAFPYRFESGL